MIKLDVKYGYELICIKPCQYSDKYCTKTFKIGDILYVTTANKDSFQIAEDDMQFQKATFPFDNFELVCDKRTLLDGMAASFKVISPQERKQLVDYLMPDDIEDGDSKSIDWEQRRYEIMKDTLAGLCTNSTYVDRCADDIVKLASEITEGAIKKLSK